MSTADLEGEDEDSKNEKRNKNPNRPSVISIYSNRPATAPVQTLTKFFTIF
jgi:hypothetical protein